MSGKRILSLKEKIEILDAHEEENSTVRALAKRFGIGKTQASLILRNREELRARWLAGENINTKKVFIQPKGKYIDTMVYDWYCEAQMQNIPVTGRLLQEKAREIASSLGFPDFSASNGWLQRFRHRHNIEFRCVSSVPTEFLDIEAGLEIKDSTIVISDDEDAHTEQEHEKVVVQSHEEALKTITSLKLFCKRDEIAFEHLKNLERRIQALYLEEKEKMFSQTKNPIFLENFM